MNNQPHTQFDHTKLKSRDCIPEEGEDPPHRREMNFADAGSCNTQSFLEITKWFIVYVDCD